MLEIQKHITFRFECQQIDRKIEERLYVKVIVPVEVEKGQILSPVFIRPKKNVEY